MARTEIPVYVSEFVVTHDHANTYWRDNEIAHWDAIQAMYKDMVVVGRTAHQSIPHNTATNLLWTAEQINDPSTMHNLSTNTDRLVAAKSGWYSVKLNGKFALNSSGFRWLAILNNSGVTIAIVDCDGSSATSRYLSLTAEVYLASGEYVYAQAFQYSGGALNFEYVSAQFPNFSLQFLRGA